MPVEISFFRCLQPCPSWPQGTRLGLYKHKEYKPNVYSGLFSGCPTVKPKLHTHLPKDLHEMLDQNNLPNLIKIMSEGGSLTD